MDFSLGGESDVSINTLIRRPATFFSRELIKLNNFGRDISSETWRIEKNEKANWEDGAALIRL